MTKPRVLVVSPTKIGLTETFIRAHIERLDAEVVHIYGYYLKYFTSDDQSLSELYRKPKSRFDKLRNLLPHHLYFKIENKRRKELTDENFIKRFLSDNNIDIVLAEYGTAGSFITPICRALKIPLVVHFHGFDASKYHTLEVFKEGYSSMFQYASRVIAVSKAMKNALISEGCPEDKLVINTYGPHPDYETINPNYSSDQLVAIGRQTYKKAPYLTLLAFKKVLKSQPNLELVMIGGGELFEVIENMVKALNLEQSVQLPGALGRQDMIAIIKESFLYVQHSIVAGDGDSEGTPVGIIEAMASGLPVISTRHAGIPDVVIEGETGYLVDERDIDTMAEHILKLAKDRNLVQKMGIRSKEQISDNFNMTQHIAVLNQVISDSLNGV